MTERGGGSGFSFEPQRVGGPGTERGRGPRNLLAVLVVLVALAVVGFALFGERLTQRPNLDLSFLPTPAPTPSASPTGRRFTLAPEATELPRLTRGDEIRSGTVPFLSDGFRLLDLANGDVTIGPQISMGRDIVLPDPAGNGWLCVCAVDDVSTGNPSTSFVLRRIETDGTAGPTIDDDGPSFIVDGNGYTYHDVALRPDRAAGLMVVSTGQALDWRLSVAQVDAAAGVIGPFVDLPAPPSPPAGSPEPSLNPDEVGIGFDPGSVLLAPDGRTAFVWHRVWMSNGSEFVTRHQAFRLTLGTDGAVTEVEPAPALADLPTFCRTIIFSKPDELTWVCPIFQIDPERTTPPSVSLRTMTVDGRVLRDASLPLRETGWSSEPLIDAANRRAYIWDAYALGLTRVDLDTFDAESVVYEPGAQRGAGVAPDANDRRPEWGAAAGSQFRGYQTLTPTPDGSRLLALGFGENTSSSGAGPIVHGIFAIDRASLALLDRWAPAAAYVTVSVLPDGRSVAAAGNPSADVQGVHREWQGSLTIHDIDDGRIVARYGQLGHGMPPIVIPP